MKIQPLIIYKSKAGTLEEVRHFDSTAKGVRWLRNEGCRIANGALSRLDDSCATVTSETHEYDIEVDPVRGLWRGTRRI